MKAIQRTLIYLLIPVAALLSSCADSGYVAKGKSGSGTRVVYIDGKEALISQKSSSLSIAPISSGMQPSSDEDFLFVYRNGSGGERVFSEEDVQGEYRNSEGEVTPIKIYSYNDLVKKEKTRQAWAALGAGLEAAGDSMSAANAGYSNSYGSYSGSSYSPYSTVNTYGTYSSSTYDYGAANAAQMSAVARSDARMDRLQAQGSANLGVLASNNLKKQTVPRGRTHGGLVRMKMPAFAEAGELRFTVNAGGERHLLVFDVTKQ